MDQKTLEYMLNDCPFHRYLRLTLVDFSAPQGWITLAVEARPDLSRGEARSALHGGVIASLIDIAGDYAVALKTGVTVPTISLHVDYLRFARDARITATAHVLRCGRSIAVADIDVRDDAGTRVAVGRGTYSSAVRE